MSKDIFEFWAEAASSDRFHPRDHDVLRRASHGFDAECLPIPFSGPLKTAPVVLLYLAPGWPREFRAISGTAEIQAQCAERRKGYQPLGGPEDGPRGIKWLCSHTKVFGPWETFREKIATLEICPYHAKGNFADTHLLAALPSSNVALDWAHTVLFPQAERCERVVVCMRSSKLWGLERSRQYAGTLYAPKTTQGGHLDRSNPAGRDGLLSAARKKISD
jgi:hypothetical protein